MAGIGFELRRLSRSDTYLGLLRAYIYAGAIGSGPWVLSILAILVLGFMSLGVVVPPALISRFETSITWLIALSLIYSGGFQLIFTRYVADRLFEKHSKLVLPNLLGISLLSTLPLFGVSIPLALYFLPGTSAAYKLLMISGLSLLNMVWLLTVLLTGVREYKALLVLYLLGYGSAVGAGLGLGYAGFGLGGLLAGFIGGQVIIVLGALGLIWRQYPPAELVDFDFLRRGRLHHWLLPTGIFFNAAIWADKFIFWLNPATGNKVIGDLHASVLYDTPIFLAYFTLIPGMAVFLLRMEVDFVWAYDDYYTAIRQGGTLSEIRHHLQSMTLTAREGVYDIIKIQGFTLLILIATGTHLLKLFGITSIYYPFFVIDTIGVSLQLIVMAGLNILFYLDRLKTALVVTLTMLLGNIALTSLSLAMGPFFFGYGFAVAMLVSAIVCLMLVDRSLENLTYETFMKS